MSSFYTSVIVNPASAGGATGRRWPQIRRAIDRKLDRWDNQFTLGPKDGTRLAQEAIRAGYEMIASVGGDGTTSEVLAGFFEPASSGTTISNRLVDPRPVLAVVRQGTGGDFARHLALPGQLPQAVSHLAGEAIRVCDVGLVEQNASEICRAPFLNIASFGLSGLVDELVNDTSKVLGGRASFIVGLGRALASYRPKKVRIVVDEALFYEGPVVTCAVANGSYFGGGMRIARDAQIDDGLFDVVVQTRVGTKELFGIRDLYNGRVLDWDSVHHTRGKTVYAEPVDAEDRLLLDIDGEQLGQLPATFHMLPGAIRLKT